MLDLSRRLLIVLLMGFCIACMFFSVKSVKAESQSVNRLPFAKEWVWPINEGEISDHFGTRDGHHFGLDVSAKTGTPTYSVDNGTVTKSYYSTSYGHVIFIKHPNGYETVYAHLSERLVKEGDVVKKGQQIGKVGNTGRSRGAHLHFEVHQGEWNIRKSNAIDPLLALDVSVFIGEKDVLEEKKEVAKLESLEKMYTDQQTTDWNIAVESSEHLLASSKIVSNESEKDIFEEVMIKVDKNMTLWGISEKFAVPIESIKEWNNLQSDTIITGQRLTVFLNPQNVYIVKNGDTLAQIEKETGVSVNIIQKLNNLEDDDIYLNQVLVLRS